MYKATFMTLLGSSCVFFGHGHYDPLELRKDTLKIFL